VESFSKQDVIVIILKTAYKKRDYQQIYSKLQAHLSMSQFMKFIFELMKYDLLKFTGSQIHYVITPKGVQYLQIYEELTGQLRSDLGRNSMIFDCCNWILKVMSSRKNKNKILENI
jgi:predicted transcriptional regulator